MSSHHILTIAGLVLFSLSHGASVDNSCTPVSPAPEGCAIRGEVREDSVYTYSLAEPLHVKSVAECASLCERRMVNPEWHQSNKMAHRHRSFYCGFEHACLYCNSFEYNPDTGLCQLARKPTSHYVVPNPAGIHEYYDSDCFVCPPSGCEAPYHVNLLDNGDFESDLFGPWVLAHAHFRKGHHSPKAYYCEYAHGPYGESCTLEQNFNTCPGSTYLLQFDYKLSTHRTILRLASDFGNVYYDYQFYTFTSTFRPNQDSPDTPWESTGYYRRRPYHPYPNYIYNERNTMNIEFVAPGSPPGGHWVDNVRVTRVPSAPPIKKNARSLISNGGFESGKIEPWHISPFPKDSPTAKWELVSPGINSKYAIKNYGSSSIVLIHHVSTTPGTSYLFQFEGKNVGDKPKLIGADISFVSYNDNVEVDCNLERNSRCSVLFYATKNRTAIQIYPSTNSGNSSKSYHLLDNFSLKEIDFSPGAV